MNGPAVSEGDTSRPVVSGAAEAAAAAYDTAAWPAAQPNSRALFLRIFPSIMLPMFLAAVDQTIVATALPAIAGDLGDVERIGWVVVSYLVATTIAAPVYGRLGDALGRKRMMLMALGVFLSASALCALAPTVLLLAAARVLQGLGGGGLITLAQALIGEAVPPRERGRYQGYLASVFMVSSTFGPVAGGWLTQHFGWRSIFLVNLPLGLVALLLAARLPRSVPSAGKPQFDWLGLVLFAAFVTPLLLALERAQRASPAALPAIVGLLAISAAALLLLLRQERRARTPLIPIGLLRQASIWRTDLMALFVGATVVSGVSFMPIYLQAVRGVEPGRVGLLLLPLTAGVALGALFTGRMIARTGWTAVFPSFGLVGATGMWLIMALAGPTLPTGWLPVLFGLMAFFLGTAMPVVQLTVQMVAGPKNLGAAAASVQLSRSIGAALGTASVGAVLFASLTLIDPATAETFADLVERGPQVLALLDETRRAAVQAEIAQAFRAAFLTIATFTGSALVLAWLLPVRRL